MEVGRKCGWKRTVIEKGYHTGVRDRCMADQSRMGEDDYERENVGCVWFLETSRICKIAAWFSAVAEDKGDDALRQQNQQHNRTHLNNVPKLKLCSSFPSCILICNLHNLFLSR